MRCWCWKCDKERFERWARRIRAVNHYNYYTSEARAEMRAVSMTMSLHLATCRPDSLVTRRIAEVIGALASRDSEAASLLDDLVALTPTEAMDWLPCTVGWPECPEFIKNPGDHNSDCPRCHGRLVVPPPEEGTAP